MVPPPTAQGAAAPDTVSALTVSLDEAVARGAFPAAQAAVWCDGALVHSSAHGTLPDGPTTRKTLFDAASLTKLVATTAATARLMGQGQLQLDERVTSVLPLFARNGKENVTVRQLLGHSSGLPAWRALFQYARVDAVASGIFPGGDADPRVSRALAFERARDIVVDAALTTPPGHEEGLRVYSDLGFIALGELIAVVSGQDLDRFCAQQVFAPLGMASTQFFDLRAPIWHTHPIAPTGSVRPREPAPGQESLYEVGPQSPEVRPGEVDDDNAFAMSGVAGHAGVFTTAEDLAGMGGRLLEELDGANRVAPAQVWRTLMRPDASAEGVVRGLGFDRPAPLGSAAGRRLGRGGPLGAVGHLGFTGTSLWIDLDRRMVVALMTNRTLRGREHVSGIRRFRPDFHDLVVRELDNDPGADAPTDPGTS